MDQSARDAKGTPRPVERRVKPFTILRADATTEEGLREIRAPFTLEELQKIVGGLIEIVELPDGTRVTLHLSLCLVLLAGMVMVVNEEGSLLDLPVNEAASKLCGRRLVGDVLYCHERIVD